jgi:hypothetical protein
MDDSVTSPAIKQRSTPPSSASVRDILQRGIFRQNPIVHDFLNFSCDSPVFNQRRDQVSNRSGQTQNNPLRFRISAAQGAQRSHDGRRLYRD